MEQISYIEYFVRVHAVTSEQFIALLIRLLLAVYRIMSDCLNSEKVRQTKVLLDLQTELLPSSFSFEEDLYFSCYLYPSYPIYNCISRTGLQNAILFFIVYTCICSCIAVHTHTYIRTSHVKTYTFNVSYTSHLKFLKQKYKLEKLIRISFKTGFRNYCHGVKFNHSN